MVDLTAAHWVYAFFIVVVLVTMTLRRETPLVCLVASLVLAWVVTGSFVKGVQAVFNVIQGDRYRTVPSDLCLYARNHGIPTAEAAQAAGQPLDAASRYAIWDWDRL